MKYKIKVCTSAGWTGNRLVEKVTEITLDDEAIRVLAEAIAAQPLRGANCKFCGVPGCKHECMDVFWNS